MKNSKPIDYAGALDTLERRADYLSRIVHPEPGNPQRRSAHWRDESELKALRHSIVALREKRDAAERTAKVVEALIVCQAFAEQAGKTAAASMAADALALFEEDDD